jgi:CHASE3 domain sensor protein
MEDREMTIENGYTQTIEAQRAALDQRQDIINSLLADNEQNERLIKHLTELNIEQGREIVILKRVLDRSANILIANIEKL